MLHVVGFYQREILMNQPANELERERGRRKPFLALFVCLKGCFKTLQVRARTPKVVGKEATLGCAG